MYPDHPTSPFAVLVYARENRNSQRLTLDSDSLLK